MKTSKNGQNLEEKRERKREFAAANDAESVKNNGFLADAINHEVHGISLAKENEEMKWVDVDLVVRRWEVGVGNPCVCSMCGQTARALGRFEMGNRSGELPWLRLCFCDGCLARLVLSFRFDGGIIPLEMI